ncbi:hypothetical protein ACFSTH_05950 [Paenibacillus yanchengensis]|uniref:Uncharacterized protein n=1 Tax=Paenibacillus yanchengensis TaxID=2035833 RepID=A0ABW4YHH2_9BACL
MRLILFYIWIFISSSLLGPLVYAISLWGFYGEEVHNLNALIYRTTFPFLSTFVWYFLSVIFLRSINKYYFWLQSLLFILIGIGSIFIVPFLTGFFDITKFHTIFRSEGLLLILSFTSISFMASYGTWVAQKKHNIKPFIFLSMTVVTIFILIIVIKQNYS